MDAVTKDGAAAAKGLFMIWEKLGQPRDASNNIGWVMIDNIIQVWVKYFPWEVQELKEDTKLALDTERTPLQAGSQGGHFTMTYPERLFQLLKTLLPDQKLNDRKFIETMSRRYPIFKPTNY